MEIKLGTVRFGVAGKAQQLLVELEDSDPKDFQAALGNWFIEAPNQSPAWRHYMLSLIHLRSIEGVPPAHIRVPGATHEFMMMAMDPDPAPDPLNPKTWSYLRPVNLEQQVVLPSDEAAIKLLARSAQCVAEGVLWAEPPLSGQVEPWQSFLRRS